jgi:hypothetical protein
VFVECTYHVDFAHRVIPRESWQFMSLMNESEGLPIHPKKDKNITKRMSVELSSTKVSEKMIPGCCSVNINGRVATISHEHVRTAAFIFRNRRTSYRVLFQVSLLCSNSICLGSPLFTIYSIIIIHDTM